MQSYIFSFVTLLGLLLLVFPVSGYDDTKDISIASKYLTNNKILGEGRSPERCSEKVMNKEYSRQVRNKFPAKRGLRNYT